MPTLELEQAISEELGLRLIAGLDEAGRGAIAGPVVAAAVILPLDEPHKLKKLHAVNDSKQIPAKQRERLFDLIIENALAYGIASSSAGEIDDWGIIPANVAAMQKAVSMLKPEPEYLLLDGRMRLKRLNLPQQSIIRGDGRSITIAAASILAKVSRDRLMIDLDKQYPYYQFAKHKGYCTTAHVAALAEHGPSSEHRHSFSPIRKPLI